MEPEASQRTSSLGEEAVQEGRDREGLCWEMDRTIRTYGNDALMRVPRATTPEEDRVLLREVARGLIEKRLKSPSSLRGVIRV